MLRWKKGEMAMTKLRRRRAKKGIAVKCLTVAVILGAICWYLDGKLQQTISTVVNYQMKIYASRALNAAVLEELEQQDLSYDDLVTLQKGEDSQVSAIETDALAISRLKARISDAVDEQLQTPGFQAIGIPLGTVLGSKWISGYGPNINFRLIPVGSVHTSLQNQFDSAGINQTRHQIMLDIDVQFTAVIPGFSTEFSASTNFCIAETIIVGPIPEAYTNVEDGSNVNMSDINDYNANDNRIKHSMDDILD
ncbi:sporulation protein YunB [Zongyangia hominis]|uniref:Sporulation protein YunB n=1 Tax=Zongyangia hominis TaxID=2763677 RepID=A0A926IAY9_9FIRM|nr:sporulation protein YunB [Zongyangia hominis]MBC8569612.1 sporulation protein YunB [Zongyangia hominis]